LINKEKDHNYCFTAVLCPLGCFVESARDRQLRSRGFKSIVLYLRLIYCRQTATATIDAR